MAINYNNNNQGIGNLDLSQYGLIQPDNNMQTAGIWGNIMPEFMGGYSEEEMAQNAALQQIEEIKKNQFEGYPTGTNPAWVEEHKTEYPDLYKEYQNKQNQIQQIKDKFKGVEALDEASLVNEAGYPLMASLSGQIPDKVRAIDQYNNEIMQLTKAPVTTDMSPGEAQARGLGAQHHGSIRSSDLHAGNVGGPDAPYPGGLGTVPGFGRVMAPPKEWYGGPDEITANVDPWSNFYGDQETIQGFDERGEPLSISSPPTKWEQFTGKMGDMWRGAKDNLSNFKMPPIGIMGLLQGLGRNPFDIDSPNYSKGLGLQVDDLREVGFLPQNTADGYKILGGPLAGKNLVSAFGTNDYDEMLAKKAAWFQRRKDLGKGFSQKNWNKVKKEQEARAEEMIAHGKRDVGDRTLGGNFQIERGGSDAVNRDLATRNRGGQGAFRENIEQMRGAARSYTDAQGNRGYSSGRKDGGRIGYANGGLASLFTRRG